MSIPKEPRQLMINLMYLVLTAMLALNVSAEIMNAFYKLDKGNVKSSNIISSSNNKMMGLIEQQADAYKDKDREAYKEKANKARQIEADLSAYIEDLRKELFEGAGGPSEEDPTIPVRKDDKEIATRLLVGEVPSPDSRGMELKAKIDKAREELLNLVDEKDRASFEDKIALKTEPMPEKTEKKNWADFNFYQMPVAAVFPMLSKFELDAKSSTTSILNYVFNKVVGEEVKFDKFQPVISATKGYVIAGDKYEAEIFLSAFSSQNAGGTKISVNGTPLKVKDGKATYTTTPSTTGVKKYNVSISVTNPLTKKTETYKKTFEYEVGRRSVAVSADKMNVFYIGVDNPVSVSAAGVSSNQLKVTGSGINITKNGPGKYNVTARKPSNDAYITVSGGGLKPTKFKYRVKRIPDPIAVLGNNKAGSIGNGTMKAQRGLIAKLENFDFEARCNIQGFEMTYLRKREDGVVVRNSGGTFKPEALRLVKKARPGDMYYFEKIKAKCPGDAAGRSIPSIAFKIR
ncbi:MAG TPA: gliding motility protein GldM [Saprospiraceae bacterium]|nr:gliding motility protein GldM [Saprospiraceae bacterium]